MTQTDVEQILARYLGVTQLVWLRGGAIEGDDTDGHVDQLARFVNSQTVVVAWDRSQRGGAEILRQNERLLQSLVVNNQPLNVVRLPLPSPLFHNEHPLPASYCNFYFVNGGLIVPTFDNNADDNALATLAELCPGCQVVGVNARSLVWGLGAVHCLTQQQPKGTAT